MSLSIDCDFDGGNIRCLSAAAPDNIRLDIRPDASLNPRRPKEIRHPDGSTETITFGVIVSYRPLLALRERMIGDLLNAASIGFRVGAGITVAILVALHYAGGRLKRGHRISKALLLTSVVLANCET